MKKLLLGLVLVAPLSVAAKPASVDLEPANIDLEDQASLQRGASVFVNSCMGCHSVQYMRWDRVARDIGISTAQLERYLRTTGERPGDLMQVAMSAEQGEAWFGIAPPDLSLVARSRGADWIYNFLLGFYPDADRPHGVNNRVFPDTAMPHVFSSLETSVDAAEYRRTVRDVTNFLAYVGEPAQLQRRGLGSGVLAFLAVFFVFSYLLKREYWKDVH